MPSAGFEPATPVTKRPQTYVLDRAATEVGINILSLNFINVVRDFSIVAGKMNNEIKIVNA
jgi:hypothetical protein